MHKIKIYILEDEIVTQEVLKDCLESFDYNVCGMQDNATSALEEIKSLKPDIAILDVNVRGEKDGIWLANQLDIPCIFLTAYSDTFTISKALKTEPSGYLIKPFENNQVYAAVEITILKGLNKKKIDLSNSFEQEIVIKDGHRYLKINTKDLVYVKADGNYIELFIGKKKYLLRNSLNNFIQTFTIENLIQVHKSYLVNINKVNSYESSRLQVGDQEIPLSRTYKAHFLEFMDKYKTLGS